MAPKMSPISSCHSYLRSPPSIQAEPVLITPYPEHDPNKLRITLPDLVLVWRWGGGGGTAGHSAGL